MQPRERLRFDEIRLGDPAFWEHSYEDREGAFVLLRREHPVSFHEEPEVPMLGKGPGFWALTRHADILEVSRNPQTFCSSRGGVNIIDQPEFLNEFFGSMIVMDDPRHTRLRRIVSRGFTPGMLRKTEADVDRAAAAIVDDVMQRGRCDFVAEIAAALPLKIICDMMGIPDSEFRFVFDRTNLILGAADPEAYVGGPGRCVPAILKAGQELAALMENLTRSRRERPTDDLTSALIHADVDGERPHRAGDRLLLHSARRGGQRDDAQCDQPRHESPVRLPRTAHAVGARLRAHRADRGRGDRPLGDAGDPFPPHRDVRHRDPRPADQSW
jgi:cytochrome P450